MDIGTGPLTITHRLACNSTTLSFFVLAFMFVSTMSDVFGTAIESLHETKWMLTRHLTVGTHLACTSNFVDDSSFQ